MDNVSISTVMGASRDLRLMFYLVLPSEATYEHVKDVPNYTEKAIPYFIMMLTLETVIVYAWDRKFPRSNDTINSLTHGMFLIMLQAMVLPVGLVTYTWVYTNYCLYELPWKSPWIWWMAAIVFDCGYYWFHRMAHEINLFWAAHQTHHSSEEYNLSTALRQSMLQQFTSWPFYLPIALFVPPSIFLIHRQLNLLFQFWIHTEVVKTMGPLEWILNTPSHHRVHHGRNPYCIDKNYAGMLIIWDRIFGTFQPEEDGILYGLVHSSDTWNPLYHQFGAYWELWKRFYFIGGWKNKLCVLFMGPGWSPGAPRLGNKVPKVDYNNVPRYHKLCPTWLHYYCYIHFFIILYTTHVLGQRRNEVHHMVVMSLLIYCMLALTNIGLLFDHHPLSPLGEVARLSFVIILDFITMETTTSFLGVGVWALRGVIMMSLSLWLLLSIKSLVSLRASKKLE